MDAERFDRLTRALAAARTRRGVTALLGAGLAGLAGVWMDFTTEAKRKKRKKKRRKKRRKRKTCRTGRAKCNGACVNLNSDDEHCGACGNACPGGSSCTNGSCSNGNCPNECCSNNDCPGVERQKSVKMATAHARTSAAPMATAPEPKSARTATAFA